MLYWCNKSWLIYIARKNYLWQCTSICLQLCINYKFVKVNTANNGYKNIQNWFWMILLDCRLSVQSLPWSLQSVFVFIRPRKIELPSASLILCLNSSVLCLDNGFINKSANWSCVWTCRTWREPRWTKSQTKWRSICMCFMRECWTRLKLRCVAPRLSQSNKETALSEKSSSWRSPRNHIVSNVTFARARYSASVVDLATALCFFELHEMGFEPKKLI